MESELYGQIQAIERDHWWYVARRRIIFDWVCQYAAPNRRPEILDIGCGTGFNIEHLQSLGFDRVTGLDLSDEALRFCRSRNLSRLVQGDATYGPFRNASFDMILALDLIEHVEDDVTALRHLQNMLKPGGVLVIFTPAFQFLWSHQDEISHHYRRYTSRELRDKFVTAGFEVLRLSYANAFLFPIVWAGRLRNKLRGSEPVSENAMHPDWANGVLTRVFSAERLVLRHLGLPFGVSLLAIVRRPPAGGAQ